MRPLRYRPDSWLYTGDLATIDENARVRIVGRKKDMFIVGGFNAYPAEIGSGLPRRAPGGPGRRHRDA